MTRERLDTSLVRGIVFDLDGTLIDSYAAITDSLNAALAAFGRAPMPPERVRAMVGRGLETLMASALEEGGALDEGMVDEGVRIFRQRYDVLCVPGTRLLPGVAPTLAALRDRGYVMGVATNKASRFAVRILEALGVSACLKAVLGPDMVAHHKPHPEMIEETLRRLGVSAAEAIYVGDMEIDVETARAAGLPSVVMPTGSCDAAALAVAGARVVLPDFAALLDLLPGAALSSRSS